MLKCWYGSLHPMGVAEPKQRPFLARARCDYTSYFLRYLTFQIISLLVGSTSSSIERAAKPFPALNNEEKAPKYQAPQSSSTAKKVSWCKRKCLSNVL